MKNIALIFAGGSGTRMNSEGKPKQFLVLHGKEIIIHTIEKFENHDEVDAIVVVCVEEWIEHMRRILDKFQIKKVRWIVAGGRTGQESIFNGLKAISADCDSDSLVLVHDGVRPMIDDRLISDNINLAKEKGSAITVSPAIETVVSVNGDNKIDDIRDRSICFHAKAPQTFRFEDIWSAHQNALSEGLNDMVDSASLLKHYGHDLHTVMGSAENIKITNPGDFYMFRALYEAKENSQIFGI